MKSAKYIFLLSTFLIVSCTTRLSDKTWATKVLNSEYVLTNDSVVVNPNCDVFDKFSPEYGIQTRANFEGNGIWTRSGCNPEIVASLESGKIITITEITMRSDSIGSCWNVSGKSQSGLKFVIPSCIFFHTDLWVTPSQPIENGNSGFQFKQSYLKLQTK